jgi:peptide/nickel transport system substrate-binding protein
MVLKKTADWWNGTVCLDQVTFTWSTDAVAASQALEAGQLQGVYLYQAPQIKDMLSHSDISWLAGPPLDDGIRLNETQAPFNNTDVRLAVALGLNGQLVSNRLYVGLDDPSKTLVSPTSLIAPTTPGLGTNPTEGASLVKKAQAQGVSNLTATYTHVNDTALNSEALLDESLMSQVGLTLKDNAETLPNFLTDVFEKRTYQAANAAYSMDDACAWCYLSVFQTNNPASFSGYSNPAFDKELSVLQAATTVSEQKQAMTVLQQIWNQTIPFVLGVWQPYGLAYSTSVHGILMSADGNFRLDTAYVAS